MQHIQSTNYLTVVFIFKPLIHNKLLQHKYADHNLHCIYFKCMWKHFSPFLQNRHTRKHAHINAHTHTHAPAHTQARTHARTHIRKHLWCCSFVHRGKRSKFQFDFFFTKWSKSVKIGMMIHVKWASNFKIGMMIWKQTNLAGQTMP